MKKRTITFALAGLMLMSPLSVLADKAEKNINESYIKGFTEAEFKPDYEVTRAELAAMMSRKMKLEEVEPEQFNDISTENHWAAGAVGALATKKIIEGYSDGTFRPEDCITRGELARLLDNAYKDITGQAIEVQNETKLTDISDHWAVEDIKKMEAVGILKGHANGTFKPEDLLTREEAVTVVNRMTKIIEKRGNRDSKLRLKIRNKFNDMNPKRWSYDEVIEASTSYEYKLSGENESLVKTIDPKDELKVDFKSDKNTNIDIILETLNIKRASENLPTLEENEKLNTLSSLISKEDLKKGKKDSVKGKELLKFLKEAGVEDKTPPQRGSLLVSNDKLKSTYAYKLIDQTLLSGQYIKSFDRAGVSIEKDKKNTSMIIYMGFKADTDELDHILDFENAKKIYEKNK
ncbi:MAG: S-layer homology domain-containing protein [Andreesenia angusta]|nr:S-layer homology domain-containing protein [Andreesenia angusta]